MPKMPSARAELQALQAALAAEHAAVYGYGVAGAMLTGADNAAARGDWESHMTARDTLQAMITVLGAAPVAASAACSAWSSALADGVFGIACSFGISRAAGCRARRRAWPPRRQCSRRAGRATGTRRPAAAAGR